jgi:hypothetical protein
MKEQNFPTSRESGTSFENGVQVDLHAASSNLISYEELQDRRQRRDRQLEEARLMNVAQAPEQLPEYEPYEGNPEVISIRLAQHRHDEVNPAA